MELKSDKTYSSVGIVCRSLDFTSRSIKILCRSFDLVSRSLHFLISHSRKILCHFLDLSRSLDLLSRSLHLISRSLHLIVVASRYVVPVDLISRSRKILCRSLDLMSCSLKIIMSRERDIKLRERLKDKICMSLPGFRKELKRGIFGIEVLIRILFSL